MQILNGHPGEPVYSLAFAPDGRTLASVGGDRFVRLWDLTTGEGTALAAARDGYVAFSQDGRWLACGGHGARVWDLADVRRPVFEVDELAEQVRFSPDSTTLVAQGYRMRRWEAGTWRSLRGWGGTRESTRGASFPTRAVAFRPDGAVLATTWGVLVPGRYVPEVRLWDTQTGALRVGLRGPLAHPRAIAFSPDGRVLAGVFGPELQVWDVESGQSLATRKAGTKHFKDLAFTPDDRTLLTVSNDQTVRLWDTVSWQERGAYAWKVGNLGGVAIAPDGLRAATGGARGKVVVWDL